MTTCPSPLRRARAPAFALTMLLIARAAAAQSPDSLATLRVRVTRDSLPLPFAIVRAAGAARQTDATGRAILRLGAGAHLVIVKRLGVAPDSARVTLRAGQDTTITFAMRELAHAGEAIVVAATRADRRIEDTPLRVEVVDEEEVAEKSAMTPGDITMMLNETSGLRVQTTSPSLGAAGVRVQGLRGRYTLLLADGLPLYGGEATGLGLLQIPPVDLARAEIIKGSASALYGPAALGGVINLVSRRPNAEPSRELLLNRTTRGGTDAVFFLGTPLGDGARWGATLLAAGHAQERNDIDADGWVDQPGYRRVVARPRLFFDDRAGQSVFATAGVTYEEREGGTMPGRAAPDGQPFPEGLGTVRADAGAVGRWLLRGRNVLGVRASATEQRHRHRIGGVLERDAHRTLFGEVAATLPRGPLTWVAGASFQMDSYENQAVPKFDYRYRVPSLFAQLDADAAAWLVLSASARIDGHNRYPTAVSPRLSVLLRVPEGAFAGWTARFSGGAGTFAPAPHVEETEVSGLSLLRTFAGVAKERAYGASLDVGGPVETAFGRLEVNATAFASQLEGALQAVPDELASGAEAGSFYLVNSPVLSMTSGVELLLRLVSGPARVTASYAFTRATEWDPAAHDATATHDAPLVPRHTAGLVASLEQEGAGRIGLELYYTGRQALSDNPYRDESDPYVVFGLLVERRVGRARWFLNAENLLDVRQTRTDRLVRPTRGIGGRWTTDVWSLLEGRTLNAGVRLSF